MIQSNKTAVLSLAVSTNSATIYSGDSSGLIRLHDLHTQQLISEFQGGAGKCRVIRVQKTDWVLTGGQDGVIRLWDCRKKRCVHALKNHSGQIMDLQLAANKRHLIVGAKDGSLKQWDLSSNRSPETISSSEPISQVAVTSSHIVSFHSSGLLKLWSPLTFELLASAQTIEGKCFESDSGGSGIYVCGRKTFQVYKNNGSQTCDEKVKWANPVCCQELGQVYCVCCDPSAALSVWGVNKQLLTMEQPQGYAWEQIVPEK